MLFRSGADPAGNFQLRTAIEKAKAARVPNANIERAIAKGSGQGGAGSTPFEEVRYEGYGPGKVALIVEALTDNRNRTASELRTIFQKNGGTLGETVAFNFQRVGLIHYPASAGNEDKVMEAAINAGADDVQSGPNGHDITCAPDSLHAVQKGLEEALGEPETARLDWRPNMTVAVKGENAETLVELDRKSTRLNSSHVSESPMPSSA